MTVATSYYLSPTCTACGECVDKLVMMHNESMQDVATLQNRSTIFNDLSVIYQQLNSVIFQAVSLTVGLLHSESLIIMYYIFPDDRIQSMLVWVLINNCKMI